MKTDELRRYRAFYKLSPFVWLSSLLAGWGIIFGSNAALTGLLLIVIVAIPAFACRAIWLGHTTYKNARASKSRAQPFVHVLFIVLNYILLAPVGLVLIGFLTLLGYSAGM